MIHDFMCAIIWLLGAPLLPTVSCTGTPSWRHGYTELLHGGPLHLKTDRVREVWIDLLPVLNRAFTTSACAHSTLRRKTKTKDKICCHRDVHVWKMEGRMNERKIKYNMSLSAPPPHHTHTHKITHSVSQTTYCKEPGCLHYLDSSVRCYWKTVSS